MTSSDESSLTALVIVATLLPVFGLIWIAATGQGKYYWERGMKGFKGNAMYFDIEANCNREGQCEVTKVTGSGERGKVALQYM